MILNLTCSLTKEHCLPCAFQNAQSKIKEMKKSNNQISEQSQGSKETTKLSW